MPRHVVPPSGTRPGVEPAHAGNRFGELDLSVAVDAGNRQNLAARRSKLDVVQRDAASRAGRRQPSTVSSGALRPAARRGCSGPATSRPTIRRARSPRRVRHRRSPDHAAVAQNDDSSQISNTSLQLVRDEDDALALRPQAAHHLQQSVDLRRAEIGRGLVQNQESPAQDRLQDLDALPFAKGQPADGRLPREIEPVARLVSRTWSAISAAASQRPARSQPSMTFSATVIGLDQHEMLVDHLDPDAMASRGVWRESSGAAKNNGGRIGPHHSKQHLHESGLSGTVLPREAR